MKKIILPIVLALAVGSFSLYSVLDTFVIERAEGVIEFSFSKKDSSVSSNSSSESKNSKESSASSIQKSESSESKIDSKPSSDEPSSIISQASIEEQSQPILEEPPEEQYFTEETIYTDTRYSDPNIWIDLTEFRDEKDTTTIHVAEIRLKSFDNLRTALAKNRNGKYGKNITQTTSQMAKDNNAILAINGDYCYHGTRTTGYILRNGVIIRESVRSGAEDLAIYEDGSFEIFKESKQVTLQSKADKGAYQVFSFGPGLVNDGVITVDEESEVDQSMADNQRCAIGMIEPLHYFFVVSDGRTTNSKGLKLIELANVMKDLGCTYAYNLDGGGSATMYFHGKVINELENSTSWWQSSAERSISDIVYIGA